MVTTSKGGPSIDDIYSRRRWSLSTGKMIDECVIDSTTDQMFGRELVSKDDIRVEVTLKNALALFEWGPTYVRYTLSPECAKK